MTSSDDNTLSLDQWLSRQSYGKITQQQTLGGGCINDTSKITLQSAQSFCLKQNHQANDDFFASEALGLEHLRQTDCFNVPSVEHFAKHFLLLEFISPGPRKKDFWQTLGQQLARCHLQDQKQFGFIDNNYCGLSPQINIRADNGFEFFAENRLMIQARWARDKGLLRQQHCQKIEKLSLNLEKWIPAQAPALLHGDLWSGNIHSNEQGDPVLIDPACYWGWPEADIAMTTLFGEFDSQFYRAYEEHRSLEQGWRERLPLYNLYHLLNHLNLFGSSYLGEVETVINRYV